MTPSNQRSTFDHRAGGAVAFLSSFVVHTSLLLALACWVYTAGKTSEGLMISAEIGQSADTSVEIIPALDITPEPPQPTEPVAAVPPQVFQVDFALKPEPARDSPFATASSSFAIGAEQPLETLGQPLKKKGAAFFGAYAEGRRFVFILDSSRSMLQEDRWTYACNQLIDSLNGLEAGQEFFVICFDIKTSLLFNMPPKKIEYFEANTETIRKVKQWLRSRILGQATMPAEALSYALHLHPDAIFLLSDGEIQDNSRGLLQSINGFSTDYSQVPIHTVHLFSEHGRQTLQMIARENGGSFTPVSQR